MIKSGVDISGIRPELVLGFLFVQPIFAKHGVDMVITSVKDGKHGRASLHYVGQAGDLRSRDLKPADWELVAEEIKIALGPQFDLVLEPDHFHLEFQPKERIA